VKRPHPLADSIRTCPMRTLDQSARAWGVSTIAARRMMADFIASKLIVATPIACRWIDPPTAPLYRHVPGTPVDMEFCRQMSARFFARFRAAPVREMMIYTATRKAYGIFGSIDAKLPTPFSASHDLLLAELHLINRHRGRWIYEPAPPGGHQHKQKRPDAGLFDSEGLPFVFIECCGRYSAERVKNLIDYSNGSTVPLELWQ